MLKRLNAGHDVYVPEGTRNSVTSVKATPQELRAAVRAARLSRAGSTPKTVPKNFPFNGYGCDVDGPYYSHWCGKYVLDVDYCDPKGCELEDRITAKVTVDPGVKKSRVVYKSLYSPDHRDFTDIHFEWWTLCYGHADVCGHHDTENFKGSSSGTFYPESDVHLYGDRLAHAFELWAYSTQTGEFVGDPGRTGTALCEERPETACVY
jgi:hypothetical protein